LKLGLVSWNPTEATTPPRPIQKEMKFYDEAQASQLLLAARGERIEALYQLVRATGLRKSEVLALKWSDLGWEKRSLTVQRQLKLDSPKVDPFNPPKTNAKRRTIILCRQTIEKLREQIQRQNLEQIAAGEGWQSMI
jgi:integrase